MLYLPRQPSRETEQPGEPAQQSDQRREREDQKPWACDAVGGVVFVAAGLAWRGFRDSITTTPATSAVYACANTRRQRKAYVQFADRGLLFAALPDRCLLDICEIRLRPVCMR
jgi:hypothetical protein